MPARKKIHTTVSDRLSTRNTRKINRQQRKIAADAARTMTTQAQYNYRRVPAKAGTVVRDRIPVGRYLTQRVSTGTYCLSPGPL